MTSFGPDALCDEQLAVETWATATRVEEYRDLIPYALDRLDNVGAQSTRKSRGRRTQDFGKW